MSISYVDIVESNNKPNLSLCMPNMKRTKVGNLTDVYDVTLSIKQGSLNEMSLSMPVYVERNGRMVKNPLIKQFHGEFSVRCEMNGQTEYFIYTRGRRKLDDSGKSYHYNLFSAGHVLSKKIVRSYEQVSKSLTWYILDLLNDSGSVWQIGYVDVSFDLMYRSYSVDEGTLLQCIFELANKFGASIEWDTVNRKINFMKLENTGHNKGFIFREGIGLESLDIDINYDEIVTRLHVFGQDGLEFRRISPTGSNFIQSFEWYMYPFEMDSNGNVLKSSIYMDDDLCIAIRKYEEKVKLSDPTFKQLASSLTSKQDEKQRLEQQLSVLEADMKRLLNERDVYNGTYGDTAPQRPVWQTVINNIQIKQNEINNKQIEIDIVNNSLADLRRSLAVENNYTRLQLQELDTFIKARTYTNDTISDMEDLLEDGLKAFVNFSTPPVDVNLGMVNFLNDVEFDKIRDRITIGDTVTLKVEDLDTHLKLKMHQIDYNFESDSISLQITNMEDLRDNWDKLLDKIQSASNTSTSVDMNKGMWQLGETANDKVSQLINSAFDTAKNILLGGYENTVTITDRGLYSKDLYDPNTFLVINTAQLCVTKDGGNSVEVAINKDGVFANKLHGRLLLSNKLWVEDDLGVVEIKSGLETIYDQYGNPRVYLGRYPTFQNSNQFTYGLRVIDGAFDIRTSSTSNSGVVIDGNGLSAYNNNSVRTFNVDAVTGKVSIVGSLDIRTSADSNKGVVIDGNGIKIYNNSGTIMFSANASGDVFYKGRLEGATGTVSNLGGSLNNMTGNVNNLTGSITAMDGTFKGALTAATGTFNGLVTGSLSADTVKAVNIEVDQLVANGIKVNDLSAISANLGNITSGQIDGVSITTSKDITVGNNLYIGTHFAHQNKAIIFGGRLGGARIDYASDGLYYSAMNGHHFSGGRVVIDGVLDLTNATVIGL